MDQDRSLSVRFERSFLPLERLLAVLVCLKELTTKGLSVFFIIRIVGSIGLGATCSVPEIESDRELEVKLDCPALDRPAQRILELHIYLGSIEGTVTLFERPLFPRGIKCFPQLSLSLIPEGFAAHGLFRPRSQLDLIFETKQSIDSIQKGQALANLLS